LRDFPCPGKYLLFFKDFKGSVATLVIQCNAEHCQTFMNAMPLQLLSTVLAGKVMRSAMSVCPFLSSLTFVPLTFFISELWPCSLGDWKSRSRVKIGKDGHMTSIFKGSLYSSWEWACTTSGLINLECSAIITKMFLNHNDALLQHLSAFNGTLNSDCVYRMKRQSL